VADDRREPRQGSPARVRRRGRQPRDGPRKRGLDSKVRLAVDADGMPVRVIAAAGAAADCGKAGEPVGGIGAGGLIADRGAGNGGRGHLVGNAFIHLKQWRGGSPRAMPSAPRLSLPPFMSGA
jgi:hypothetical protein